MDFKFSYNNSHPSSIGYSFDNVNRPEFLRDSISVRSAEFSAFRLLGITWTEDTRGLDNVLIAPTLNVIFRDDISDLSWFWKTAARGT